LPLKICCIVFCSKMQQLLPNRFEIRNQDWKKINRYTDQNIFRFIEIVNVKKNLRDVDPMKYFVM
jgi:hypothetical protein